ncbi:ankyrin repeat domain-containing protein [Spiroplasma ixodetis]|uniref:ankyrin repeat domain-containing protein n=1 Tax=Spiroplasma ixodetis TaxID=2141 RepID=UPI003D7D2C73
MKILIENGANINHANQNGDTALIISTKKGYLSIINVLIKNGANINHANQNGDTALHLAAKMD